MQKDSDKKKKIGGSSSGTEEGESLDSSKFASETQESEVSILFHILKLKIFFILMGIILFLGW